MARRQDVTTLVATGPRVRAGIFGGSLALLKPLVPSPILVMARSFRLLAAIPLLSLMVAPALASGRYQVQPRDSFYSVARKCRVDVHELMGLNPRPDNALKLGEKLRLPGNAQCGSSRDLAGAAVRYVAYQVQPRESFYGIARKCQVDAKELMRLNSASGTTLQPGQQLTLPGNARCPGEPATAARAGTTTTPAQTTARGTIFYQVQPREGFYSVAQKCQVDTRELISLNPESPTVLRPGQQLKLPSHARCPDESATVASSSPSQGAAGANRSTDTTATQTTPTKSYYEVQPRDAFYSIARKCRVNAQALMALNPRPGNTLHVGDQLELPGGAQCDRVAAANPDAAAASAANSGGVTVDSGWRSYGPLKVDWQDWQKIEGHWVAKSLNRSGQSFYLAINCPARRINQTSSNGQWSAWEVPDPGFEEQLMDDLCQEKKDLG
ncbi:MAG: LysM peptidoglycan-binding domain-containing protein [Synechococcus sp. SB0670_bin_20]|nr:LysM peptidoglycan-binding domain-containing protein [Synechococcus sp. SB0670_bin_20]